MKTFPAILITFILTALIVGGGVYSWQKLEPKPVTEPVVTPADTPTVKQKNMYQDAFLSFEYPEEIQLLVKQPLEARSNYQSIEFLAYDASKNTYQSTDLSLSYMVSLGESDTSSFNSMDDLLANYQEYNLKTTEYNVDGRRAVQIITEDMSGETFFLVISADENGNAYRFKGPFLTNQVEEILALFIKTAQLSPANDVEA